MAGVCLHGGVADRNGLQQLHFSRIVSVRHVFADTELREKHNYGAGRGGGGGRGHEAKKGVEFIPTTKKDKREKEAETEKTLNRRG